MRLVLVIRRVMGVGGAEVQARLLAAELVRRGVHVTIVTERVAHICPPASIQGIPVHAIRSVAAPHLINFVYMAGLACYLIWRRRAYDVVHVFFLKESALAAVAAAAFTRRPIVVRPACAGPPGDLYPLRHQPLWRRLMGCTRRATVFAALSAELEQEMAAFGCPRRRIRRIPNGVPVPPSVPSPAEAPPVAVFVGRLAPQKGLPDLLRAWQAVVGRRPDARLHILGDGPQRPDLEALAHELGIAASVTFAGQVDDVPARLLGARTFVLPSTAEGMSVALLEAMAAGRAVVATRVSGTVDLVRDGENGLLVDPGDVAGLARALERVLAEPALADALGRRARELVSRRYSIRAVGAMHVDLYTSLTGPRGRRRDGPLR